jgi:hypothetical protein
MQNLAFQLEFTFEAEATPATPRNRPDKADLCFACGDELFRSDGGGCDWKSRHVFWEILGMRNVELLCGG